MIVLIPASRYVVSYDLATGRPYSHLEALTLEAVGEGRGSVDGISKAFRIHRRLAIESLLTLIHAGWVAVGSAGSGYVLTAEGEAALSSKALPPSHETLPNQTDWLVMERVTGAIARSGDIELYRRDELGEYWEHALRLPLRVSDYRVDEGQIQHLLRVPPGHWIERVNSVKQATKHADWALVNVDVEHRYVRVPERWDGYLRDVIVESALRSPLARDAHAQGLMWPVEPLQAEEEAARSEWPERITDESLLLSANDHGNFLTDVLSRATRAVFIASASAESAAIAGLRNAVIGALERGVRVDLLWGPPASPDAQTDDAATEWTRINRVEAKDKRGTLRLSPGGETAASNLLIWDDGESVHAAVGSWSWLSMDGAQGPASLTVKLKNPRVVAAVARCAAGLWADGPTGRLSPVPDYWRRVAAELEYAASIDERPSEESDNCAVRLVQDHEHGLRLREFLTEQGWPVVVSSSSFEVTEYVRIIEQLAEQSSAEYPIVVIYARECSARDFDEATAIAAASRAILIHDPDRTLSGLFSPSCFLVGSHSFFNPVGSSSTKQRHVSVEILGIDAARPVLDLIAPSAWINPDSDLART